MRGEEQVIVPVSGEQVASAAALALRRNSGVGAIKDVRTRFYELPYCSALYPLVYHSSVIFVHDEQNAVEVSFGANGAELLQGGTSPDGVAELEQMRRVFQLFYHHMQRRKLRFLDGFASLMCPPHPPTPTHPPFFCSENCGGVG